MTVRLWLAEPPLPVQVKVKAVLALRLPVTSEPEVALLPLQPPEALQEVALVLLQVRVEAEPEVTEVGEAEKEMVGGLLWVVALMAADWADSLPALS